MEPAGVSAGPMCVGPRAKRAGFCAVIEVEPTGPSARLGLLLYTPEAERAKDLPFGKQFTDLCDLVSLNRSEFELAGQAREEVERRYLAGQPALFPDDLRSWNEQLESNKVVEALVVKVATAALVPERVLPDSEAVAASLEHHIQDLVEPAKVAACEDLDEGRIAIGIATSWLRGKMETRQPASA